VYVYGAAPLTTVASDEYSVFWFATVCCGHVAVGPGSTTIVHDTVDVPPSESVALTVNVYDPVVFADPEMIPLANDSPGGNPFAGVICSVTAPVPPTTAST